MTLKRKAAIWLLISLILGVWVISPILFPQYPPDSPHGLRTLYSPDGKYRVERLRPGLYTPWSAWQNLTHECVMFLRLYDHRRNTYLGSTSWFGYTACYDPMSMIHWPDNTWPGANNFSVGDSTNGTYNGADINLE